MTYFVDLVKKIIIFRKANNICTPPKSFIYILTRALQDLALPEYLFEIGSDL